MFSPYMFLFRRKWKCDQQLIGLEYDKKLTKELIKEHKKIMRKRERIQKIIHALVKIELTIPKSGK